MAETLFYLLGALALAFAVGVVRARMPLFSVLSLLGSFFCLSGIYLLLGFPFLAATQLLVYAGAIMVLFLFVIMLLNLGDEAQLERHAGLSLSGRRLFVGGTAAALLGIVGLAAAQMNTTFVAGEVPQGRALDDLPTLAGLLFTRYMLPFEAASLLLLATMVGVIVLAKRQRGTSAVEAEAEAPALPAPPLSSGAPR
ncbi:MAG: NADH-quinone oxidoreductase subunit J [Planctomycetes bacterium]|nr:NADH-quinone oxidoreductase subunit J [Planctomycetota bacterium]